MIRLPCGANILFLSTNIQLEALSMSCINTVRYVAFEAVAQLLRFRRFPSSTFFPIIGCPVRFIVAYVSSSRQISEPAH
jgi:hypothetical protein